VTDQDEWLQPGAAQDEVSLEVDDPAAGLVLRARLTVTLTHRRANLVVSVDGARARHDAEQAGPAVTNWDRMRIGGLEWRMVEPLRRWELAADDPEAGLRAYLAFSGTGPCTPLADGYEQVGRASGQLQLAERIVAVTDAPSRRTHTWAGTGSV